MLILVGGVLGVAVPATLWAAAALPWLPAWAAAFTGADAAPAGALAAGAAGVLLLAPWTVSDYRGLGHALTRSGAPVP
ncbi:hypothetical protein [Streptomonospora sp. PA3]|uniref:hypothetical protein n=1 Tax=Streptomonospora sp. PA3 TaxID=2607326 RepID=UPI00164361E5|nr:hypothetical protein [Streptomonospora sp. PA3]